MSEFEEVKKDTEREKLYQADIAGNIYGKKERQLSETNLEASAYSKTGEVCTANNMQGYRNYKLSFIKKESVPANVIQGKFLSSMPSEDVEYFKKEYIDIMTKLMPAEDTNGVFLGRLKWELNKEKVEAEKQDEIIQDFISLKNDIQQWAIKINTDFIEKENEKEYYDMGDVLFQFTEEYKKRVMDKPFFQFIAGKDLGYYSAIKKSFDDGMNVAGYESMKEKISEFLGQEVECELPEYELSRENILKLSSVRKGHSETMSGKNDAESLKAAGNWDAANTLVMERAGFPGVKGLYELFKAINYKVIKGQEGHDRGLQGSDFRSCDMAFRDVGGSTRLNGVIPAQIVSIVYSVMDRIASRMKEIAGIQDVKKRNGAVISLAAMANETLLSVHAFVDGNGRTCRLFADYLLLTFGLPPAIPASFQILKGLNESELDFTDVRNVFMDAVRESVRIMGEPL